MNDVTQQQFLLSGMLARDPDARRLHTRHLQVLEHVCTSTTPRTASLIAAELNVSLSQLSRLLGKLEYFELLSRTSNRPSQIVATDQGRALVQRISAYATACLAERNAA